MNFSAPGRAAKHAENRGRAASPSSIGRLATAPDPVARGASAPFARSSASRSNPAPLAPPVIPAPAGIHWVAGPASLVLPERSVGCRSAHGRASAFPASATSGPLSATSLPARKSSSSPRNASSSPCTAAIASAASRRSRRVHIRSRSASGPASHPHRPSRAHAAPFTASRRRRRCQAKSGWEGSAAGLVIGPFHRCSNHPLVSTPNDRSKEIFRAMRKFFSEPHPQSSATASPYGPTCARPGDCRVPPSPAILRPMRASIMTLRSRCSFPSGRR